MLQCFLVLTLISMEYVLNINFKMQTIVDILTFMTMFYAIVCKLYNVFVFDIYENYKELYTCIKWLICTPLETKIESCFSLISSDRFI